MLNDKSIINKDLIKVNDEQNDIAPQSVIKIQENLNNSDNHIQDRDLIGIKYVYNENGDSFEDNINSTNDENKENFEMDETEGSERSSSPLLIESKYQNSALLDDSLGIVKKRGRPKKPKSTSTPVLPKRRVGRPRKTEIDVKVKGPVGRPRKKFPSNESCESLQKTLPSAQDSYILSYNLFPNKTYSGRGRPPRGYIPPPKPPKKPRGRPRIIGTGRSTSLLNRLGTPVYSGRGRPPRGVNYMRPPKPPKRPRGRPRLSDHSKLVYSRRESSNESIETEEKYVDIEDLESNNDENNHMDSYSSNMSDDIYDPLNINEYAIHNKINLNLTNDNSTKQFQYSNELYQDLRNDQCYNSEHSITDNSDGNNTLIHISKNLFRNKNLKRKRNGLPKLPKQHVEQNQLINDASTFNDYNLHLTTSPENLKETSAQYNVLSNMSDEIQPEPLDTDDSQPTYMDLELDSQIYDNNTMYSCNRSQNNCDFFESIVISDSEDESVEQHHLEPNTNSDPTVHVPIEKNDSQLNIISLVSEDSDSDSLSLSFEDDDEELLIPMNSNNLRIV